MSRVDRAYLFATVFLAIAAAVGGITLALQHSRTQPLEIVLRQAAPSATDAHVYIEGAVANPGIYHLREDDTLASLLLDVGLEDDADPSHIRLHIPRESEAERAQRIDINRAEPWLLEALPGIGEVRAQAIVSYRAEQGPFRRLEDLLKVSGVGPATFDRIREYITVSDW